MAGKSQVGTKRGTSVRLSTALGLRDERDDPADHFGLVDNLDDAWKIGNGLLGELFLIVAG